MFGINVREIVAEYMPPAVQDSSKIDASAVVEITWTIFACLQAFYVPSKNIEAQADFFAALLPEVEAHIDGK
jgi:hypothetical protein